MSFSPSTATRRGFLSRVACFSLRFLAIGMRWEELRDSGVIRLPDSLIVVLRARNEFLINERVLEIFGHECIIRAHQLEPFPRKVTLTRAVLDATVK